MAPPKISDEEIIEIQSLFDKGSNIPQIQEKTGKSTSVIDRYIKAERIKPKIPTVPQTEEPTSEPTTEPPTTEQPKHVKLEAAPQEALPPVVSPYPEIPEPEEWLKSFLESYRLSPPFIQSQYMRVKRRNQLPTPADLMNDMQYGSSGQKNPILVRNIIDDYDFAVDEYVKERDQLMNIPFMRRRGIPLDRGQPQPMDYARGGIPTRNPPSVQYNQYGQPYQQYGGQPEYDPYSRPYDDRREGIPVQPMQQYAPPPYPRLESELERYARIQQLFQKTEERNPVTDRLEKENDALSQRLQEMERSMKDQMIAENTALRNQLQQQGQAMRQSEDSLREAQMKLQFEQSNKRTTEEDVKMQEADHKFNIENKKLDESGKTREAIANAVKTGFSQVGQAIFATAQELGSEEKIPMQGITDTKNMWQSECPFCSTTITAPLSAKVLTCPGCGRQLEVSAPTTERQIERPQTASFTVEQPPLEQPPLEQPPLEQPPLEQPQFKPIETSPKTTQTVEPLRISECPFCKTSLTIPAGLDVVECPRCKKRLRVEAETPTHIEVPKAPPTEVPIQVPKELHIESPPAPEIITEPQPVKDQIIEQPIVPEPIERFPKKQPPEKFTTEEKKKIDRSIQDAKEGRITPLKIEEEKPIIERPKHKLDSIKKLEEELEEDKVEPTPPPKEESKTPFTKDGYTLFKTTTKSGTPFYYFGKTSKAGEPCFEIPEGRELGVNSKTGLPILRKKKE